jgi:uncharacterized membrane protein
MDSKSASSPQRQPEPTLPETHSTWQRIKGRILGGLLIVLPILITLWLFHWLYSSLETKVIDPLAQLVLWKVRGGQAEAELPFWFENYAAPLIAIVLVLVLLYFLGFLAHSRLRRAVDWVLLRVPVMSGVYEGVRSVFQSMERQSGKQRSQRVVLIPFPHPGLKAAAFVTATCRDIETQKTLLCVYLPQSPLPTIGIHLCRGNFKSAWVAEGGYEPVAEILLNEMKIDGFFLEYDDERSGDFAPLRFAPKNATIVLGLMSSKKAAPEPKSR